jgi:hypothetical protein
MPIAQGARHAAMSADNPAAEIKILNHGSNSAVQPAVCWTQSGKADAREPNHL